MHAPRFAKSTHALKTRRDTLTVLAHSSTRLTLSLGALAAALIVRLVHVPAYARVLLAAGERIDHAIVGEAQDLARRGLARTLDIRRNGQRHVAAAALGEGVDAQLHR